MNAIMRTANSIQRMLKSAINGSFVGIALISAVVLPARADIDGEHGRLHIEGELTDSPCRLSMDSADQTIDLGSLASSELSSVGAKSLPKMFILKLQDCLPASGHDSDEFTSNETYGINQPVVAVSLTAPADPTAPSLIKLQGVRGIGLSIVDSLNKEIHLGSYGFSQTLTPGDNQLIMKVAAERTNDLLVPGVFRAAVDISLSYE